MRKVRGQAALEFLTTYGWVMIVVLIAISALGYFGVFNPDIFIPERCFVSAGFSCNEFKLYKLRMGISQPEVIIILQSHLDKQITILAERRNFDCPNCLPGRQSCDGANPPRWRACGYMESGSLTADMDEDLVVNPGATFTWRAGDDPQGWIEFPEAGKKELINFEFMYEASGEDVNHTVQGEVFSTVEQQN